MTVIRTPPRGPARRGLRARRAGQLLPLLMRMSGRRTPNSLDALEPRLTEEACCDDWGIDIGRGSESD